MFLDSLVTSLVQKNLNELVGRNTSAQRRLARLKSKILSVHITDINKKLIFVFGEEIQVLATYDVVPSCSLSMELSVALQLKDKTQLATLIKQDKLQLEGNIDVLQQFVSLIEELDFDFAEWLSYYTGDVVAHTLVAGAKLTFSRIKTFAQCQQRYFSEAIIEEWKFAPSSLEVAYFVDSVNDVESKALQFELRLKAFEATLDYKTE